MPTNGMTIDSLNTVSSLTAQDEVPVWDKEASGEPTRKITAQNMANSVKSLASLPNTTEMNNAIAQSTAGFIKIAKTTITINYDAIGLFTISPGQFPDDQLHQVFKIETTAWPSNAIVFGGPGQNGAQGRILGVSSAGSVEVIITYVI